MALFFYKEEDTFLGPLYCVQESILGWNKTRITTVKWTKDLTIKKVGTDPWQTTSRDDREWFNKYYLQKF